MTLSDEQIDAITDEQWGKGCMPNQYLAHRAYARAIERALLAKQDDSGSDSVACMAPWQPIDIAPKGTRAPLLGIVGGDVRLIRWGKTSHVPLYGWCLADQGAEDFDLCKPTHWMPLPPAPGSAGNEVRPTNQPTALQSCPFCGGEAEAIDCSVHCNNAFCEAQPFTSGQSQDEAIAAWNRRATPTIKQTPYGPAERMDVLIDAERYRWLLHNCGLVNEWALEWNPAKHPPLIPWLEQRINSIVGSEQP